MAMRVSKKPQTLFLVGNNTYIIGTKRVHRNGSLEVADVAEKKRLLALKNGKGESIWSLEDPNSPDFLEDDEDETEETETNSTGGDATNTGDESKPGTTAPKGGQGAGKSVKV